MRPEMAGETAGLESDLLPQEREPSASLHIKRLAKPVAQNMLPDRELKLISMEKAISDESPYSYSRTSKPF